MRNQPSRLTRLNSDIDTLQIALHCAKTITNVERLRAKLHSCEVPSKPITHTPIYFERPAKGYTLPSLGQWKQWIASRQGTFTLNGIWHVLCLACGMPIPVSSGSKTVVATHGHKTIADSPLSKIVVGAIVKWREVTEEFRNVYSATLPIVVEEHEEKVVRLVTSKGLGCADCQLYYKRVEGRAFTQYRTDVAEHTRECRGYELLVTAYQRACRLYGIPVDEQVISQYGLADPPRQPIPYILVNPKDIKPELTTAYWREHTEIRDVFAPE